MIDNEEIIINNQNLIYYIINTYFGNYQNKNDLFQVGCIGLIKASKNYNQEYNTKFSTYAFSYIMGEIKNYIRSDKGIKISHDMQKIAYKVEKVRIMLYQKLMREPTMGELSNFLNIQEQKLKEIMCIPTGIQSLDETFDDSDNDYYEYVASDENRNIDDIIALRDSIKDLNELEQKIIKIRYKYDMTQTETAKILGMSQVQVSRNEKKVLIKLRDKLRV